MSEPTNYNETRKKSNGIAKSPKRISLGFACLIIILVASAIIPIVNVVIYIGNYETRTISSIIAVKRWLITEMQLHI
jgi:hypothetical protein